MELIIFFLIMHGHYYISGNHRNGISKAIFLYTVYTEFTKYDKLHCCHISQLYFSQLVCFQSQTRIISL